MYKVIISLTVVLLGIIGIYAFSIDQTSIPSTCIQYKDECGNMCIRKRNNSRSCEQKTCAITQQAVCVAETNDVDLDEKQRKIVKQAYVPKVIGSNTGIQIGTGQSNGAQVICSKDRAPVCGMVGSSCNNGICKPIQKSFLNACIGQQQGAAYIQPGACDKIKAQKRKIVRK